MTRLQLLREYKKKMIATPHDVPYDFKDKCLKCLDVQIRAEQDRERYCMPGQKIVGPLAMEKH